MKQYNEVLYPFPKGARVACIGDSITALACYSTYLAAYYKQHFPDRGVVFHNSGIAGGTLHSVLQTYDTYVAPFKATHALIMIGVNDSRRGALYMEEPVGRNAELEDAFQQYVHRMDELMERLTADGIEIILCTPAPYAEFMKSEEEPIPGCYALIRRYADYIRSLARKRGCGLVDIHAYLSERYLTEQIYRGDHVHPNELGQYRLAECILKAQGLDTPPFYTMDELAAVDPLLGEWSALSATIGVLYTVELLVVEDFTLPTEEKLALVKKTLDENKWENNAYFKEISNSYMKDKPGEGSILERIECIAKVLYA